MSKKNLDELNGIGIYYYGTMFSGKSTKAFLNVSRDLYEGKKVLVIKPSSSEREGEMSIKESSEKIRMKTHSGLIMDSAFHQNLTLMNIQTVDEFLQNGFFNIKVEENPLYKYDVLWIDEFHFLNYDLAGKILNSALHTFKLKVYISLIDSWVNEGAMEHLKLLFPGPDNACGGEKMKRLAAVCQRRGCKNKALHHVFTKEYNKFLDPTYIDEPEHPKDNNKTKNKLLVGSHETYMVLCRSCYQPFKIYREKK